MYFNCPNHPKNFQKFKNLYIRRIGFCFQKNDYISSKVKENYSGQDFNIFIDNIHEKTHCLILIYKIITIFYILSWALFLFFVFTKMLFSQIYCMLPLFAALLNGFFLIRLKEKYMDLMKFIVSEENNNIIRRCNMKWILGPSAGFLQFYNMDEEKVPLNL